MVNTVTLPSYGSERFYMLSELELKAHSTIFLSDHFDNNDGGETIDTVGTESDDASSSTIDVPPFLILYILWRPGMVPSTKALAQGVIQGSVLQLQELGSLDTAEGHDNENCEASSSSSNDNNKNYRSIYIVVDLLASQNNTTSPAESNRKHSFQQHIKTAEDLARQVSQTLRGQVQGISIGVSDHNRAAPGLEACVEAVTIGAQERRRAGSIVSTPAAGADPQKSFIGMVAIHADDLLGGQVETDAAQGVMQSLTTAEWNGHGNLESFSRRAHSQWCQRYDVTPQHQTSQTQQAYDGSKRRRRQRIHQQQQQQQLHGGVGEDHASVSDPISMFMILLFVIWVILHITTTYNELLENIVERWHSILDGHQETLQTQQILEGQLGDEL